MPANAIDKVKKNVQSICIN